MSDFRTVMNLQLSLKTKWFELTKSLEKTEDYRDITPYWVVRFFHIDKTKCDVFEFIEYLKNPSYYKTPLDIYMLKNGLSYKEFKVNTITLGYPKKTDYERILKLEHKGIEVRTGNTNWGAIKGVFYFVVKHGNKTE